MNRGKPSFNKDCAKSPFQARTVTSRDAGGKVGESFSLDIEKGGRRLYGEVDSGWHLGLGSVAVLGRARKGEIEKVQLKGPENRI